MSILGIYALLTARMVVASGVPAVSWEIALEAGAEAYISTLRQPGARATQVVVQIPRRIIDDTVLEAAELVFELGAAGRIAAYARACGPWRVPP